MNYQFNKERIIRNIERLGGKVKVNSFQPGVFILKDGKKVSLLEDDLFSETNLNNSYHEDNLLNDVHVDKEKEVFSSFNISKSANSFPENMFIGAA